MTNIFTRSPTDPPAGVRRGTAARPFGRGLVALAALAVIAAYDLRYGEGRSLSTFYMVPVAIAAWGSGSLAGTFLAIVVGLVRLVAGIGSGQPGGDAGWNAGMSVGLLVTVSLLIDSVVRPPATTRVSAIVVPGLVAGAAGGLLLGVVGRWFDRPLHDLVSPMRAAQPAARRDGRPVTADIETEPLPRLAQECRRVLQQSRPLLLGSRDLSKGSCVDFVKSGQLTDKVPQSKGDLDGGPGTTLAVLLSFDRQGVRSALEDLRWHQTRLASYLENQLELNDVPFATARDFHAAALALADRLAAADALPQGLGAAPDADESTWPGYCLHRLADAVRDRDLPKARRWSRELESAAFWLADLHRWRVFLFENFRTALRFQALAREPFEAANLSVKSYGYLSTPSNLPGGMLTLHGLENFLELERQAETIFFLTPERLAELDRDRHLTAESIRVPPAHREAYLALAGALSDANRRALATAATLPYECGFLINMLYRAHTAGMLPELAEVLRRFDRLSPASTPELLMGVLVYRGHSFSGIEWADRFQPRVLDEALTLRGDTDATVFADACRLVHELFEKRTAYGVTLSLRDSLDRGIMDCVRATDLTIDLFRNNGRSGIGHVRWAAGTAGHTVPALWGTGEEVLVVDPLEPKAPERWPAAYFQGARWPEFLRENAPPATAELYVRGLDSYVWAQGYVIRGEHAGTLGTAAIPYLSPFAKAGSATVFAGPYPSGEE